MTEATKNYDVKKEVYRTFYALQGIDVSSVAHNEVTENQGMLIIRQALRRAFGAGARGDFFLDRTDVETVLQEIERENAKAHTRRLFR